ncbi:hypothetical protein [Pseudomonas sp. B21-048]|uniref:hypothetical protein n=1 Tax=Pseudomonas sp. B21-048 TaxID=2895490 RepID=UPI00215F9727|nr:hypothetical protein [Pseudomonas sp. B21-048]UVK97941.1 hypothetical protein LOY56_21840 [Pseudomonas sp. B21-048]
MSDSKLHRAGIQLAGDSVHCSGSGLKGTALWAVVAIVLNLLLPGKQLEAQEGG